MGEMPERVWVWPDENKGGTLFVAKGSDCHIGDTEYILASKHAEIVAALEAKWEIDTFSKAAEITELAQKNLTLTRERDEARALYVQLHDEIDAAKDRP